jgi:type IV pilus assembly protein PilO
MKVSLAKLSWKTQAGVFLAVSALLVGAFYQWWVVPAQAEMAERQSKLTGLRGDINRGLATARQLPDFRRQVTELQARLESLRAVLPEQKDVGDLLRRIQTLAMQSSLQIKGFKPAPIVTKQMHAEWPINLELDGTYHNLGRFFDQVGKFSRIINVSGIHIKAKDKPSGDSTISAECIATTFVLFEAPAAGKKAMGANGRPVPTRPAAPARTQ